MFLREAQCAFKYLLDICISLINFICRHLSALLSMEVLVIFLFSKNSLYKLIPTLLFFEIRFQLDFCLLLYKYYFHIYKLWYILNFPSWNIPFVCWILRMQTWVDRSTSNGVRQSLSGCQWMDGVYCVLFSVFYYYIPGKRGNVRSFFFPWGAGEVIFLVPSWVLGWDAYK